MAFTDFHVNPLTLKGKTSLGRRETNVLHNAQCNEEIEIEVDITKHYVTVTIIAPNILHHRQRFDLTFHSHEPAKLEISG